ncbi:hypothetical protein FKR81_11190 [Lentzea tibetensis]|uniref:V8-like Glu-specific endopeptidase n=1 Tax=Lentzea tibetensis TaxID=2591470 RepID=A0A563EWT8_9PSEU|nr:hypothetical protein [Lentzea tibetensis]TWP52139.1 hypothetical protein FKR81_11190 [Lentzea tibetensis]
MFRRTLLAVVSGLALTASVIAPATAAPAAPKSQISGTAANPGKSEAQVQKAVDEYWTTERMAEAKPATASFADQITKEAIDKAGKELVASQPASPAKGDVSTNDAWFSYTTGKVFYTDPRGGNWQCSGAAVNSGSKRVVVTAGHCVHPGSGTAWMQNWNFVPGYQRGSVPRGRFYAYWFWSSTGWTQRADRERDFAFVVTYNNASGQRVVDAAGGHGLIVNPGYSNFVHIAGYPGNRDGGEVQWYCWGTTDKWPGAALQRLGCNFGGGSSGGPWLRDYQPNGLGYVISDMHGIASDGSGYNAGPYYDNHVRDVFNQAANQNP